VERVNAGDAFGDLPARRALESGPEKPVHDNGCIGGRGIEHAHRGGRLITECDRLRRFQFGAGEVDHAYIYARTCQSAGDNPRVTAIVSRTRKNDGAVAKTLGVAALDFPSGSGSRAIH
jgi:hypothetical protein